MFDRLLNASLKLPKDIMILLPWIEFPLLISATTPKSIRFHEICWPNNSVKLENVRKCNICKKYKFAIFMRSYVCNIFLGISMLHCAKNVQIQSFFWSIFSRILTKYWDLLRIQSKYGKYGPKNSMDLDTFYAALALTSFHTSRKFII